MDAGHGTRSRLRVPSPHIEDRMVLGPPLRSYCGIFNELQSSSRMGGGLEPDNMGEDSRDN
jgi:hypothetical protein